MTGDKNVFNKAINAGHSAAWDQNWDKAAENYRIAVDEFPDNPKALRNLGLSLFQLKRLEESMQTYMQAAKIDDKDSLTMERIALIAERLGQIDLVVDYGMKASNLFMENNHVDKAIDNLLRVIMVDPANTEAHTNLAFIYEKTDRKPLAIKENLALAFLYQHNGKLEKAESHVNRSLELDPKHPEAINAKNLLMNGETLPEPSRLKGGTGPLRMADIRQMEKSTDDKNKLDPISEAVKTALTRMASALFELSSRIEKDLVNEPSGNSENQDELPGDDQNEENPSLIKNHLGQAIDAQTHGQNQQAGRELEDALKNGFQEPALYFDLGFLQASDNHLESALRYLEQSINHQAYSLASRLLMGDIHLKMEQQGEACRHYLEALKLADSMVVPSDQVESIRQLYEPIIECYDHEEDKEEQEKICHVIDELLNQPDWRKKVEDGRAQLPESDKDSMLLPLAHLITQTKGSQVIDAMRNVRELVRQKKYRSAMEEAYFSLQYAPTYLPLHSLISDILLKQENQVEALAKLLVIANAYKVRGENQQATAFFRKIMKLSPMDVNIHNRLIDHLISQGQVDEALNEYIQLAELYYNQAELDLARKTYTNALKYCQNADTNNNSSTRILKRMADIDMQRLDLRQASRIYEQIRTIDPDDPDTRRAIIDLYIRLGKSPQADAEIDNYFVQLSSHYKREEAIHFLEDLMLIHPREEILFRHLAEEYRLAGRVEKAAAQLNELVDLYIEEKKIPSAIQVLETIISMDPPDSEIFQNKINTLQRQA
ncbi:MAG TPA: tetratricopeptide repeat protein [Anaerolineales bacterium]|nr:tetratricopeptide repeat protein [Anaerolineales bacterium]